MFKLLIVLDISVNADVGIATNWLWERSTDSTTVDWNKKLTLRTEIQFFNVSGL